MSATSMFDDSCSFTHQFNLNYEETSNVAIGHLVSSQDIFAGGHLWRINCYPRGPSWTNEQVEQYISIFLMHLRESKGARAMFEAFVMDGNGARSSSHRQRSVHVYTEKGRSRGWLHFVKRSDLNPLYLTNGSVIIMCRVKVLPDDEPIEVPPSNITSHLSILLDSAAGSDVSFVVDGEKFPAHRAVLAARSPVFMAQLLGSMADARMASITLQDIAPATFKIMLRFIYTDELPEDEELDDGPPAETFYDLLAAADRYALDRLKLLCARKMWEDVSAETIGATLACAETYNCPELKKKCIDFFADENNFRAAVLTDGFVQLVQKFPSILAELRVKVGAQRSHA
ncbi:unnamed protein product [Urochloa humidicola]